MESARLADDEDGRRHYVNGSMTGDRIDWAGRADLGGKRDGKLILPTGRIDWEDAFIHPGRNFGWLLPMASPESRRRRADDPSRISGGRRPDPGERIVRTMKIMAIGWLDEIDPRMVARPTRRMNEIFIRLDGIALPGP